MSAIVRLPISDYEERLLGKRLITTTPTFSHGGVKVFHCEPNPASLASGTSTASPYTPSALQKLPAEIRLHILAKIFEDIKPLDWLTAHHRSTPASVIFTCKHLYHESRQLALKACTFEYKDLPDSHRVHKLCYSLLVNFRVYGEAEFFFNEKHVCDKVYYSRILGESGS